MSIKKMQYCQNNLKNSYREKKAKYKPSGYSWCSICSFDDTKNKRYFYRGKDCIEKFCKDLKEIGMEIINFIKKEIKSYEKQKVCYICEKKFCDVKSFVLLKKENDNGKKITYKLKFIGSYRFMSTSLSNLFNNLSDVYDKECKKCMERKKIKLNWRLYWI